MDGWGRDAGHPSWHGLVAWPLSRRRCDGRCAVVDESDGDVVVVNDDDDDHLQMVAMVEMAMEIVHCGRNWNETETETETEN